MEIIKISVTMTTNLHAERSVNGVWWRSTEQRRCVRQVEVSPAEVPQLVRREKVGCRLSRVVHVIVLPKL